MRAITTKQQQLEKLDCCLFHGRRLLTISSSLKIEAMRPSETSVNIYQSTQRHFLEYIVQIHVLLWILCIVLAIFKIHNVSETYLLPIRNIISGGGKDPTQLGPLEKASLEHGAKVVYFKSTKDDRQCPV
jgi:hypothetical protein